MGGCERFGRVDLEACRGWALREVGLEDAPAFRAWACEEFCRRFGESRTTDCCLLDGSAFALSANSASKLGVSIFS